MNNQSINWKDPLYLESLLSEEEKKVLKTAKDFCSNKLFGVNSFLNKFFNSLYILIGLDM